jgi:ACS family glucarate transporter-like MFS transporter
MKATNVRWKVITLLFLATTINYIERVNISVAMPQIAKEFHFSPIVVGNLFSAFFLSYALLQLPIGVIIDKISTKLIYIYSVVIWGLCTLLMALANSFGFIYLLRFLLGVGEAPAFPAATKAAAKWIPRSSRGIATGLFTAGVNLGSAITLPLAAFIVAKWGWRMCFLITGLFAFIWLIVWLIYYRELDENPRVNDAERALIKEGTENIINQQQKIPYLQLLKQKYAIGLFLGYFCQIYAMFIALTWLPTYLVDVRHMTIVKTGLYGVLPFIFGTIFAFIGGAFSDWWVKKTPNGRKYTMALGLLIGMVVIFAGYAKSWQFAILFFTISHSGIMFSNGAAWGACSEMAPSEQVGSLASIQNFGGNIGAFLSPIITGTLVQLTGNFISALVVTGFITIIGAIFYIMLLPPSKTTAILNREI